MPWRCDVVSFTGSTTVAPQPHTARYLAPTARFFLATTQTRFLSFETAYRGRPRAAFLRSVSPSALIHPDFLLLSYTIGTLFINSGFDCYVFFEPYVLVVRLAHSLPDSTTSSNLL